MCMLLTRVHQGPAMLWPWEDKAMAHLRDGAWVLYSLTPSHAIRDNQQGHDEETIVLGSPFSILSSYPYTKCRARLATCSQREMHQSYCGSQKAGKCARKWMTCIRRGVAGGGMRAGLSPPTPSSQDTWNMQNSD